MRIKKRFEYFFYKSDKHHPIKNITRPISIIHQLMWFNNSLKIY